MAQTCEMKIIAHLYSDYDTKFGVPRQSGLVDSALACLVFEPEYRNPDALRGLEGFSHLWLIWQFSQAVREDWSPTVRPPRLGGNTRMGVFATRSPFRPNPIGLSCVAIDRVENHPVHGPVIWVRGADLVNGTPVLDLKPYLPYADSRPDARGGFASARADYAVAVEFPPELEALVPPEKREALRGVLALDPRPAYQDDPQRLYGVAFAGKNVRFTVKDGTLTVRAVENLENPDTGAKR